MNGKLSPLRACLNGDFNEWDKREKRGDYNDELAYETEVQKMINEDLDRDLL